MGAHPPHLLPIEERKKKKSRPTEEIQPTRTPGVCVSVCIVYNSRIIIIILFFVPFSFSRRSRLLLPLQKLRKKRRPTLSDHPRVNKEHLPLIIIVMMADKMRDPFGDDTAR